MVAHAHSEKDGSLAAYAVSSQRALTSPMSTMSIAPSL